MLASRGLRSEAFAFANSALIAVNPSATMLV